MLMEGWVKCLSPLNSFGVSGVNCVAAKSNTIEVDCEKHKMSVMLVWCHPSVSLHLTWNKVFYTKILA